MFILLFFTLLVLSFFIINKKFFFFGFKESFLLGFLFYIFLPLIFVVYYEKFLLENFELFNGYDQLSIISVFLLSILSLISFLIGYYSLKRKIKFLNLNDNFSLTEICFAMLVFIIPVFFTIEHANPTIVIYVLISLTIFKLHIGDIKKIFLLIFFLIIIQYFTTDFSGSRRDIVKLFIIFLFFSRFILNSNKSFFILFILLFFISINFVFLNTYNRSSMNWDYTITMAAIIENYDFMPTFDNFIYIINSNTYLLGETLFKIFYSWIPRELWPSKPYDSTILIVSSYKNKFVGGSSQSVGLLGELYWNFSWLGVFLGSFLLGILAKSYDLAKNKKLTDIQLIIYSSLSYLIFILWRGGISTSIIIYLKNIIALVIVLYLVKLILRSKYKY